MYTLWPFNYGSLASGLTVPARAADRPPPSNALWRRDRAAVGDCLNPQRPLASFARATATTASTPVFPVPFAPRPDPCPARLHRPNFKMDSEARDKAVYLAKLAEQAERYDGTCALFLSPRRRHDG